MITFSDRIKKANNVFRITIPSKEIVNYKMKEGDIVSVTIKEIKRNEE